MKTIFTENAPVPAGHYSQAIIHNNLVFVSGQIPINPVTGEKNVGTVEEQTKQVLSNLSKILIASGSSLNQVLKVTVYISDIQLWDHVNRVYAEFFGNHKPARCVVPTRELHYGFQVEIDAIACTE